VCGLETREAVCPRCSTIVLKGQAICPKCGKMFTSWIASCDACGSALAERPPGPRDEDAVRSLASVPGISEARARDLVSRGFRDFSDVVRLALPDAAVSKGLHHAIARKVLLSTLGKAPEPTMDVRCPACGTPWLVGFDRCVICGAAADVAVDVEALERKLQEVTGEIVDLAADEDFRGMPADVREELLAAFGGMDEAELLREDYGRQIEAWRRKGFDVAPLERLLREDLARFQERSVRIIRAEMMKKAEGGRFRCPLCEIVIESAAEECPNCGARFG
jgi:rubrerythrin